MQIKNIFWDVDGVLADLNYAYYKFLTQHPNWREKFAGLEYKNLAKALTIHPEYAGVELSNHPTHGAGLNDDFITSEFYDDRPLYPGVRDMILRIYDMGINQTTMSATGAADRKLTLLKSLLGGLPVDIRITPHGDTKEENMLKYMAEKNWNPSETILVDDRPYNLRAAIRAGVRPIRFRSEFTTDSPADLKVPEFDNYNDLIKFIDMENK
jgi:FMN phosphatase YigB (HAD superfamily)